MRLTAEEEITLARRVQAGDRDARNALVEANLGLVYDMARHFWTKDVVTERRDLEQCGVLGLMEAAERFDPERGVRFSTYAWQWIRQAMSRAARTAGTIKRRANTGVPTTEAGRRAQALRQATVWRLDAPLSDDGEDTLLDVLPGSSDVEMEVFSRLETERLLSLLSLPHQRLILETWLYDGLGINEASVQAGYSRGLGNSILVTLRQRAKECEEQHDAR